MGLDRTRKRAFRRRHSPALLRAAIATSLALLTTLALTSGPDPIPDLDVDSDNNSPYGSPDRDGYEDAIEDTQSDPQCPGKFVPVNDNDDDNDGVPDFADGFNWDCQWEYCPGPNDDANWCEHDLVPLVLELPWNVDLGQALICISYNASYPGRIYQYGVTQWGDPPAYAPAPWGSLRIWKRDWPPRNPLSCKEWDYSWPTWGDFVPSDTYEPWQLGFSSECRTVTLLVEGIAPSTQLAGETIEVWLYPEGYYGPAFYDRVRLTCVRMDLDVDSDNTNGFDAPSRTDYEDQTEDAAGKPEYPGKLIQANDGDDDGDGIPDFADGFNRDGLGGNEDDATSGKRFVPLVLEIPNPLWDIPCVAEQGEVTFTYAASDPAQVVYDDGTGTYIPASGRLRLWRRDGGVARSPASAAATDNPGDFIPGGTPIKLSALGLTACNRVVTLYVEGIAHTTGTDPDRIAVSFDPDGPQGPLPCICRDAVRVACVQVDLDADSDNTAQFDGPSRTTAEDQCEDISGEDDRPGKVVLVDSDDSDRDGVPDFADGFDYVDGADADDTSENSRFVPLVLEIPEPLALETAEIEFDYSASDPAGVAPTLDDPYWLPSGSLRLWKKDGSTARDKRSVAEGGDFVAAGTRFTPAQLGLQGRTLTLYLEAVRESTATGDLAITVRVYPLGGNAPGAPHCEDTVRVTATRLQVLQDMGDAGEPFEAHAFAAVHFPDEGATALGCGSAPGGVAVYRVRVYDPRQGIASVCLDGQDLSLQRNGAAYETATFVGILPEDQQLLDEDEPFILRLDEITEGEYNAEVPPNNEAADPLPWSVSSAGEPQVAAADGVLDVDTSGGEATYCAALADPLYWHAGALSAVSLRFQLQSHNQSSQDGAFALRVGDDANHWFIGVRPDRLVHYANGARAEIILPPQIGQEGSLLDGGSHTLRIVRAAGGTTAEVSIDYGDTGIAFEVEGVGTPANGILWGDPGEAISGRVLYDYVHWGIITPGDILYETSPSQMVAGREVVHFGQGELPLSYNPEALPRPSARPFSPTDLDEQMARVADSVVEDMEATGWSPVNPADDGEFGSSVHARVSDRLRDKSRWLADVYVDAETKEIVSIGSGHSTETVVQVDAIGLERGYRPKKGNLLDVSRAHPYELKASLTGDISAQQKLRLKAVFGDRQIAQVRAKRVWRTTGWLPAKRYQRTVSIIQLVGLAATAWRVIHYDAYDEEYDEMAAAWLEFKRYKYEEPDPAQAMEAGARALGKTRQYLSNFLPDDTALNIVTLREMYRVIGQDW